MTRPLLVVGPVPPPYHGVCVSTSLVLANPALAERFEVEHFDTSDRRSTLANVGNWDLVNVLEAIDSSIRLARRLRGRERGLVYLPLSQGRPGFLRDAALIFIARACGWRVASHLRGGEFDAFYERQPAPFRWLIRATLARLDSIAVLGTSLRSMFVGLVAPERIAVVPNGTPDIRQNGAVRDREVGLYLGNLRRRKGVVEAVEAALRVVAEVPTARFLFVGAWEDADLERTLRRRVAASAGRIRFLAPVTGEEKDALLARAGYLLFPPVEPEGHPRVVLEALAAGLPVVTTARGAITETVEEGRSGFVLDDPVPAELAERMLRLLRDPELHARMSRHARERYLAAFTEDHADRAFAEWLDSLVPAR